MPRLPECARCGRARVLLEGEADVPRAFWRWCRACYREAAGVGGPPSRVDVAFPKDLPTPKWRSSPRRPE